MSNFYLPSSTSPEEVSKGDSDNNININTTKNDNLDSDSDSDSDLPFPAPLSRATFSSPSFSPTTFLSSLSDRHQSLSDLQTELQDLSKSLSAELLDLVNDNYQSFLSLGTSLKGGDEKCEEVKVGVLGFERDVRSVRDLVEKREREVRELVKEGREVRKGIMLAGDLLGVGDRVEELEGELMISTTSKPKSVVQKTEKKKNEEEEENDGYISSEEDTDYDDEGSQISSEDDDDDDGDNDDIEQESGISLRSLERSISKYKYTCATIRRIGETHPFIQSLQPRLRKIRETLMLDLKMAQKSLNSGEGSTSGKRREKVERLTKMMEDVDDNDNEQKKGESGLEKGVEGMRIS